MRQVNIIFLDIDGVLVTGPSMRQIGALKFCPEKLELLDKLIERLNGVWSDDDRLERTPLYTRLVISSSWRQGRKVMDLKDIFHHAGSRSGRYILDRTGKDKDCKGLEIQEWLDQNDWQIGEFGVSRVRKFVIIDDDADMRDLTPHLVKTEWNEGLTQEQTDHIYEYFANAQPNFKAQLENAPALEWTPATPYAIGDVARFPVGSLNKVTDEGSSSGNDNRNRGISTT